MTNDKSSKYNLEERTAKFGENIIKFCNKLPKNVITSPLINQLVKSGTSVGANYCEADDAESRADKILNTRLAFARKSRVNLNIFFE